MTTTNQEHIATLGQCAKPVSESARALYQNVDELTDEQLNAIKDILEEMDTDIKMLLGIVCERLGG